MGTSVSRPTSDHLSHSLSSETFITGLGVTWPDLLIGTDQLRDHASQWYSIEAAWSVKETLADQPATRNFDLCNDSKCLEDRLLSAEQVDEAYRRFATPLAVKAAQKALEESDFPSSAITPVVAVTATNAGSPGLDQLVANEPDLSPGTERILLNGVGCAGGLSAMRIASDLGAAASCRGREARILVVACEICSIQSRAELYAMSLSQEVGIGPALFSDGAAALVICNNTAMSKNTPKQFGIVQSLTRTIPGTFGEMSYRVAPNGFLLRLSRRVPKIIATTVREPFVTLGGICAMESHSPVDLDWALHPGGISIIQGVQASMGLPQSALQATYDIYRTRGNTSSVAVLAVLDHLHTFKTGKRHVVAASFGPGLTVEMAMLKRF